MKKNKNKVKKNKKTTKIITQAVAALFSVQVIVIAVLGIILIKDTIALNNYRELQKKQIAKLVEDCDSKIDNGMNQTEDLSRRMIRTLANVIGSNPDTLEYMYLRDLSMSYCRASEFVYQGIQNVNGRSLIRGDYLFGTGDTPRRVTSDTFKDIQW